MPAGLIIVVRVRGNVGKHKQTFFARTKVFSQSLRLLISSSYLEKKRKVWDLFTEITLFGSLIIFNLVFQ